MDNKEIQIKAAGFDALINGLYFVITFVSFILTVAIFLRGSSGRASFATCFIMVVPCILDGVKDFVAAKHRRKFLAISDFIILVILCAVAITLLVLIFEDLNILILSRILIYVSILGTLRYALIMGFSVYDVAKEKRKLRENENE